ncbi:MAG: ion transporter [Ferruginibacter sp.]
MTVKQKLYEIVFTTDTKAARVFDIFLLWAILFSIAVVMAESVPTVAQHFHHQFLVMEWVVTIIFTIEYLVRIYISPRPIRYILSFWGIIDFLSILPTFLIFFIPSYHYLLVVRIFRLLRVFRILKLARFTDEAYALILALKTSMYKISIFMITIVAFVIFLGTLMYVVEDGETGFTSIPQSIYWAIVTVSTVGYGDMVPHTVLGKFISSIAMILGYAIIAVPTGIVTVALSKSNTRQVHCHDCDHLNDNHARYCNNCGNQLKHHRHHVEKEN